MRIGFVGLGVMGKPMALHLLRAGFDLTVFDVRRTAVTELVSAGARRATDVVSLAERCAVTITMLPNGAIVEDVVTGHGGLLERATRGSLLIDMSTIEPERARRLAEVCRERGVGMLDAPVSGGEVGATEASLSIMIGGGADDVARAEPILRALGTTIVHVGDSGAGQVVKACNQVVVAVTYAAVGEALVLGSKSGVRPDVIIDALLGGLARNRILEVKRDSLLEHDFRPGGSIDMTAKDLRIALECGEEVGVAMPFTALVQQLLGALRANGKGQLDHSALLTAFESAAGHRIGAEAAAGSAAPP